MRRTRSGRAKRQVEKKSTRFTEARNVTEGDTLSHHGEERTIADVHHYELNDVDYVELTFEPEQNASPGIVRRSRFRLPVIEREDE